MDKNQKSGSPMGSGMAGAGDAAKGSQGKDGGKAVSGSVSKDISNSGAKMSGGAKQAPVERSSSGGAAAGKPVSTGSKGMVDAAPAAEVSNDPRVTALQDELASFHERTRMTDITREVSEVAGRIQNLPGEVEQIRSRGYAFRSYLENKAEVLNQRWTEMGQQVQQAINDEVAALGADIDSVEQSIGNLTRMANEGNLNAAQASLGGLTSKVEAAESRIQAMYQSLESDVNATFQQLSEINWFLDQKDEASFDFLPGEALFLAAKAEWVASGKSKNDPDGILYLSDQRLIFEQKETTGKRLGMFGGKQEQEVEWELPLSAIKSVEAENKGLLGGKDMLNFDVDSGQFRQITVEVKGGVDCKYWQKQIQRMVSGDAANERAIEPDPEMIERLQRAPTACHVCGGTLPRLVAGQSEVECGYCGAVIRI